MSCEKCKSELNSNYCPDCGAPAHLTKINGKYIIDEISNVMNFRKGIFYTIKELLIRPGDSIREFIHKDRHRLMKPVIFIILTSLIFTFARKIFHFKDNYVSGGGKEGSAINIIVEWIQQNYGYANILMALFIAVWIKVFFKKYKYNYFEILILLCFLIGVGMLIFTVFGIIESITDIPLLQIAGMIGLAYYSWGIGQFFDKSKKRNYLKGFLSYFLGMVTFFGFTTLLGLGIDFLRGI